VKGIGIFVAVLLVAGGIAMYVYTRPPDRSLDAQGRAWVSEYESWSKGMSEHVDRAAVSIGVSRGDRIDQKPIPKLDACGRTLAEIGQPPALLQDVLDEANRACGEVAYALALNAQYGATSLASARLHLQRAGRLLVAARQTMDRQLSPSD
jgi:hypothetical protein